MNHPALALRDVSLWRWGPTPLGARLVLRDITWEVQPGEQWAVMGPNGSGKTSLLSIAAATRHPSRGHAEVLGHRLGRVDMRVLRERIGHVDPAMASRFASRLTAVEVVLTGVTGSIALLTERILDTDRMRAVELLRLFGCAALVDRVHATCSHGERQRILLARALMRRPELVLLDEPMTGLDIGGRELMLGALDSAASGEDRPAVVFVTQSVEELPASTSHALLLREGRAVAKGPADVVLTDEHLSTCFGLPLTVSRTDGRYWCRRVSLP